MCFVVCYRHNIYLCICCLGTELFFFTIIQFILKIFYLKLFVPKGFCLVQLLINNYLVKL